jgi:hypothetical protein
MKNPQLRWRTIVGVVQHVNNSALDTRGREQAYFPQTQRESSRDMTVVVRTTGDPTALANSVRAQLAEMDPAKPIVSVA